MSNGSGGIQWSSSRKGIEINDGSTKIDITEFYTIHTGNPGWNLRLPKVSTVGSGKEFVVKNLSNPNAQILIMTTSTDIFDDPAAIGSGNQMPISYGEWVKFVSYGGNTWYVFKGL
jgi:hypothetical protein